VEEVRQRSAIREIVADRSVAAVLVLALFINVGTGMVLPILPLYARSFGVSYAEAGLLVAAFYIARLVFDLTAGVVLDRLGIAAAGAIGLLAVAAGALFTGLSPSFPIAVFCWAIAGAGAAIVWAAMYNALIRSVPKSRMARALSLFYGAFNGGIVAGGFLGGLIAGHLGLPAPLFFLAAIAAGLAGLMRALLPKRPPPATSTSTPSAGSSTAALFRIPGFASAVVALLANLWMFGAVFNTLVPLYARDVLRLTPVGIGILFAVALATEFLAYYPAGNWADTRGRRVVLIPAFACLALTALILGWASSVVVFGLLLSVLSIASGFSGVPPAAILADVLPGNRSARGVAIFRFGGDLGFSLGPLVAGVTAASLGFKAAFAIAGIPAMVALVVVALSRETLGAEVAG
jgi:DHA1 family multidrug resistance protein-like MFS transporter